MNVHDEVDESKFHMVVDLCRNPDTHWRNSLERAFHIGLHKRGSNDASSSMTHDEMTQLT